MTCRPFKSMTSCRSQHIRQSQLVKGGRRPVQAGGKGKAHDVERLRALGRVGCPGKVVCKEGADAERGAEVEFVTGLRRAGSGRIVRAGRSGRGRQLEGEGDRQEIQAKGGDRTALIVRQRSTLSPSEKTTVLSLGSTPSRSYVSLALRAKSTGSPESCRTPRQARARVGVRVEKKEAVVNVSVRAMWRVEVGWGG